MQSTASDDIHFNENIQTFFFLFFSDEEMRVKHVGNGNRNMSMF